MDAHMSQRVTYACDRCKKEIGNDARYVFQLSFVEQPGAIESFEGTPAAGDLCGFCANMVRVLLDNKQAVIDLGDEG
jgi:hypothetical protein